MATRSKRLRSASLAGDSSSDCDFPLHMDPTLMTERQQLAFLLRKTAQENGHDAPSSRDASSVSETSESSDDDSPLHRASKKPRRAVPTTPVVSKTSPRSPPLASRDDLIAAALKNPANLVLYCGRGRPPKNAIKLAPGEKMPPDLKRLVETAASHLRRNATAHASDVVKDLRVTTTAPNSTLCGRQENEENSAPNKRNVGGAANVNTREKTSPSSARELSQHLRDVFEDHHGEFNGLTPCALCCRFNSQCDAPLEALFLCPTCDRKYPTQRALGLV